jgi:hypothetical protein
LPAVDEVIDVDDDFAGALSAECFLVKGIHEVKLLDFLALAGFACALCCVALCGAIRPARQPTP